MSRNSEESKEGWQTESKVKNQIFPEPLDSIKDISLYPEPDDIHLKPPLVRPNIIHGSYGNSNHYLDVQFRLLREDFISPLRNGVTEFIHKNSDVKSKKYNNIHIYKRVRFLKTTITIDKVGYIICFDVNNTMKNMNWEFSKRFMYGSLLLFTMNNFETFIYGTVINRDLENLKKKQITVQLVSVNCGNDDSLMNCDYLMAESEIYFEPYFHVLSALQNMDKNNFPLEKYIVNVQTHTDVPLYLRNGLDVYEMKLKYEVRSFNILDYSSWPHWEQFNLDESQYLAFRAALTNELALIQGPPGTGKTYIGLKIMETLLNNKIIWNQPHEAPILVVCYTNHTLDQFLEGILNCTTNIIRIGGQNKNEALEPFNLKNRRRFYGYQRGQSPLMNDLKKKMSTILNNIKSLQNNLDSIEDHEGIVSLKFVSNVLTVREKSFFNNNTNLIEWLLEEVLNTVTKSSIDLIDEEFTFNDISDNTDMLDIDDDPENLQRMQAMYFDAFDINNMSGTTDFANLSFACTIQNVEKRLHELVVDKVTEVISDSQKAKKSNFKFYELKKTRKTVEELQEILAYLKLKLNNKDIVKQSDKIKLIASKDIKALPYKDRWMLYKLWLERLKVWYKEQIRRQEILYRDDGLNFEEARHMEDLKILKMVDVVGMTTTTAVKFQAMLRALQPKIVIIEEAAEVLEAHIVASLTSHCKHLVLIGDHKQLRPNLADYAIGKNLHLEISLFERLIKNGIECYTLNIQHRMRPEISTLLVPTIYPNLLDHPCVHHREKIRGIDKSVFFITHESPEQEIAEISSKQNKHEADFLVALCHHLLLQGYKAEDITILTTYSGQLYYLRNEKKKHNLPRELCIRVFDNFQGEESKIILLSLVRSNNENKVGFLKTENSVCVALSRARDGLYIIGNMHCLTASSELWQNIRDKLIAQGSLGRYLTLQGDIHPDNLIRVSTASDFYKVSEGGCGQLCSQVLACGHTRKSLCHVISTTHDLYACREPCLRKCKNDHPCKLQCYIDCRKCTVQVERKLLCGHIKEVPCYVNTEDAVCRVEVEIKFEPCKHVIKVPCYQSDTVQCPAVCEFRLNCGHACDQQCHVNDDPDHLEYVCVKPCAQLRKGCSTVHHCRLSCCEDCEPCKEIVIRELGCKHQIKLQCATDILQYKCQVNVVKIVKECGHKVTVKCCETPTKKHCNSKCQYKLTCGHICSKKCSEECNAADCTEGVVVESNLICGHNYAFVPCNLKTKQNKFSRYCMEKCTEMLECKHRCSGTCGRCLQGRIHKPCEEDCRKVLICGHSCTVPCDMVCPPCGKPCTQKCEHSVCPRKCGEICAPCNEPCTYNCIHYKCTKRCSELCDRPCCYEPCRKTLCCLHQCVGFCGEPCPPCKECEPELYEIFFGTEDDDDARLRAMVDILSTRLQEVYTRWEGRARPTTQRVQQTPHSLLSQAKTIRQKKKEALYDLIEKEKQVLDRELFKIKENEWNILPEKKKRPFMGLSCATCTPSSRTSLLEKDHQNVSLINVLWVHQLDTHPKGLLPKLFPQLCHALSFKKFQYPYIYDSVLQDDHLQEVIDIAARQALEDVKATAGPSALTAALKRQHERAVRILTNLRSTFSDIILRISSYVINKVMARLFSSVVVHPSQIEMLRRAEKSNLPLIFVPLHRSHLDYIVITFILCNGNIRSPLVAAGENLKIPVFGWLLRCLGAFFIKRRMDPTTGQKDILYRAILHTYMIQCLGAGHNFEFFIEGGRTRSGKPCMPKGGLLSVFIDAYMDGTIDDALLVPVSINYERLVDGNFVREQMGKPKQMETFGSALSAIWHALTSHYGSMRVDFNQPFSLRELVTTFQSKLSTLNGKKILHTVPSSASLYGTDVIEEHRQLVDSIARHVIYDCCRSTAVMSTNATSFLLLNLYRTGVKLEVLVEAMDKLRDQIRLSDRDLGFTGDSVDVVNHAVDVLGPGLIRRERDAEGIIITPITILPNVIELSYYSYALLPHFVLEAVVATATNSLLKAKDLKRSVFHNELMEQSLTLCDILQFEFIFTRTCQSLSAALAETIETFCSYDIFLLQEKLFTEEQEWGRRFARRMEEDFSDEEYLSDGEESENNNERGPEYQVNENNEKYCLYKVLLQAIIDGYIASALNLYQLVSTQVPERDHVEAVLHDIRTRLDTGEFTRGESLSVDTIRNSLKLMEKWDVLDCHNQDQIKLYYLGAQYDDETSFANIITKIQQFQ